MRFTNHIVICQHEYSELHWMRLGMTRILPSEFAGVCTGRWCIIESSRDPAGFIGFDLKWSLYWDWYKPERKGRLGPLESALYLGHKLTGDRFISTKYLTLYGAINRDGTLSDGYPFSPDGPKALGELYYPGTSPFRRGRVAWEAVTPAADIRELYPYCLNYPVVTRGRRYGGN
jgi:hypothetical protein